MRILQKLLVPPRKNRPELLDEGAGTLDAVRQSLHDLRRLNRYLGGMRAVMTHLQPRLDALTAPATVLDIGTGDASLLQAVNVRYPQARLMGVDLTSRHLQIARETTAHQDAIHLLQADALQLPYATNSVDYVICSLLLHHFTRSQVVTALQEAYRCARYGIIMSDLTRGWLAYAGYKIIQPLFNLHPITRQDGETSILRGFTRDELAIMAADAGLSAATIHAHPMFRMTLVVDK